MRDIVVRGEIHTVEEIRENIYSTGSKYMVKEGTLNDREESKSEMQDIVLRYDIQKKADFAADCGGMGSEDAQVEQCRNRSNLTFVGKDTLPDEEYNLNIGDQGMVMDRTAVTTATEQNVLHGLDLVTLNAEQVDDSVNKVGVNKRDDTHVNILKCKDTPKVTDFGAHCATNTQAFVDEEIEHHFKEDAYMHRFEENLIELKEVYEKCLNNFEVSLALYPENLTLAELKAKYNYFFKMFDDSSPISKVLCIGAIDDKSRTRSGELADEDFIPNYSLGLSQMTPKNLHTDLDGIGNSPPKLQFSSLDSSLKCKKVVEYGCYNIVGKHNVGHKENNIDAVARPRRGIKASRFCRSPYVSRVLDVRAHQITTEEKNIWEWLFKNKRNINETLFEWKNRMCTRGHYQSMQENTMIESTVIDTWSYMLNENEILRDDSSPLRLFMTSETTYGPLVR